MRISPVFRNLPLNIFYIVRNNTGMARQPAALRETGLQFAGRKAILEAMDLGQTIFVFSRLVLGALSAFFAIMLWSKTRDTAWMLVVIGTIAAYIGIVYSIMEMAGIAGSRIGSVSLAQIVLPALPAVFYIAAFLVKVIRRSP